MKKFTAGVCCGLFFGLALVAISQETFYQGKVVYISVAEENLRVTPKGTKIGTLTKEAPFVVVEDGEEWVRGYTVGYIWKKSLTGNLKGLQGKPMQASMIVVRTETEAKEALAKLKGGTDFAALAKEVSIDAATAPRGGDLGEFYKGDVSPEIEAAVGKLQVSGLSGIVKMKFGYTILKRTN